MFDDVERSAIKKAMLRIIPFLFILYISAFLDRINLSYAAVGGFKKDLGLSEGAYGFGAGIFFWGYCLFEVPSNLLLERAGARKWIARIMITWAIVSASMMFVRTAPQFYFCRFLLGIAEAGFFPGMIFYLTYWFPAQERARAISRFMLASPLAGVIGAPLSTAIIYYMPHVASHFFQPGAYFAQIHGWQWLFLLEGVPSLVLAFVVWFYLTDKPEQATWLNDAEKKALIACLEAERAMTSKRHHFTLWQALTHPRVLLLIAIYFTMQIGNYGLDFWMPAIMKEFKGLSDVAAKLLPTIPYVLAAIGMFLVGTRSDKTGERSMHIFWPCLVSAIAMGLVAFVGGSPVLALIALSIAAVGPRAAVGPFWALPSVFLTGTAAAGGIAFINSIGNLGGSVGPWLVGKLKDHFPDSNMAGLFVLATAIFLTGFLALWTRKEPAPTHIDTEEHPL